MVYKLALAAFLAYRLGWVNGARRMAASISGTPTGFYSWNRQRREAKAARRAEVAAREARIDAAVADPFGIDQAIEDLEQEPREPGQYL